MRPAVGDVINNKYRLVRLIGDGGMGSVYEARHELLGTTVALKFLHPELSRRQGLVQRFLQEARVSAQIQSPHVVRVTDVDQTPAGLAFLVMEFVHGRTLQGLYEDLYREGRRLTQPEAMELGLQILAGLEAAHARGIVHRDLKPDNVMIAVDDRGNQVVKLLDFGIAKLRVAGELDRGLTRPGVVMGTPEYMAPEQAYSADSVDLRADIFSMGVIFFEMLAGCRPVGGDDAREIAATYLSGKVPHLGSLAPSVPPALAAAVHRAMAPNPRDRFGSAAEFRAAVLPFAERGPSAAPTTASGGHGAPAGAVSPAVPATMPPAVGAPAPAAPQAGVSPFANSGYVGDLVSARLSAELGRSPVAAATPPTDRDPVAVPYAAAGSEAFGRPGGTAVGAAYDPSAGAGTASMPEPYVPPLPPILAPERRPARRQGFSVGATLGVAAAIAGLVVGGLFVASRLGRSERDDAGVVPTRPTTTVVHGETPTATPPPVTPLPPTTPGRPLPTAPTATKPTVGPKPTTAPTTTTAPAVLPTIPPLVIPTALPPWFPQMPGAPKPEPPAQPKPGGDPPSSPAVQPTSRPVIHIPVPGGN